MPRETFETRAAEAAKYAELLRADQWRDPAGTTEGLAVPTTPGQPLQKSMLRHDESYTPPTRPAWVTPAPVAKAEAPATTTATARAAVLRERSREAAQRADGDVYALEHPGVLPASPHRVATDPQLAGYLSALAAITKAYGDRDREAVAARETFPDATLQAAAADHTDPLDPKARPALDLQQAGWDEALGDMKILYNGGRVEDTLLDVANGSPVATTPRVRYGQDEPAAEAAAAQGGDWTGASSGVRAHPLQRPSGPRPGVGPVDPGGYSASSGTPPDFRFYP